MTTLPAVASAESASSYAISSEITASGSEHSESAPTVSAPTDEGGPIPPYPPYFSHPAGFHPGPFDLELSHPDPDAAIFYTTDGSEPTTASTRYEEPLHLADRSGEPNSHSLIPTNNLTSGIRLWMEPRGAVRKAEVIRARACVDDLCSPVVTRTYFPFEEGAEAYALPVISVVTDSLHLFSDETGIYVPGDTWSPYVDDSGNYYERGENWEHPASMELFGRDGTPELVQDIGIRIHGGFSRRFPQKSLRLYARSDYGESRFNHRIFPGMEDDSFNRLFLRNSGNDFGHTMFMDAAAQALVTHFNVDTQATRQTVVFLNGEFWGIHNIRERYDKHYLERVYTADPENIDLLTMRNDIKEGSAGNYQDMLQYLTGNDLSDDGHFAHVGTLMDIDNFLDYYSAQVYYGNNDWPHNNIDFWRSQRPYTPYAPPGLDGRWRWLLYDVDRSLGYITDAQFDMVEWVTAEVSPHNRAEWPNLILNNLLDNDGFRRDFINRMADHLNTAFHPDRVAAVVDSLRRPLLPVIDEHIDRWQNHSSRWQWDHLVDRMFAYAAERPGYQRAHMARHFDIGAEAEITVDTPDPGAGYVAINATDILPETPGIPGEPGEYSAAYPWTGTYFTGNPVTLTANSRTGFTFSHWASSAALPDTADIHHPELALLPEDGAVYTAHFVPGDDPDRKKLTHFWLFTDDIPNNTPLSAVAPFTSETGGAYLEYRPAIDPYPPAPEGGTAGIMDRVNDPTKVNFDKSRGLGMPYLPDMMRGVRVRNPSVVGDRESCLILHLPTTGLTDPKLRFAARRTPNGQRMLDISWSASEPGSGECEEVWRKDGLKKHQFKMFEVWNLIHLQFNDIPEAADNPWFRVRICFAGDEDIRRGDDGNVRFNNITLSGHPAEPTGTDRDGSGGHPGDSGLPGSGSGEFSLDGNYPNPFNPDTRITYTLPSGSDVTLAVYNLLGQRVAVLVDGEPRQAGIHAATFHAGALPSGVYLVRLQANGQAAVRKITLIK